MRAYAHMDVFFLDLSYMDLREFVEKYGEATTRSALRLTVGRIRSIISEKVARASSDGVVLLSIEELRCDVASISCVLRDFTFSPEEEAVLIHKAWEIVSV